VDSLVIAALQERVADYGHALVPRESGLDDRHGGPIEERCDNLQNLLATRSSKVSLTHAQRSALLIARVSHPGQQKPMFAGRNVWQGRLSMPGENDWFLDQQRRNAERGRAEREDRENRLRADGFKVISVLSTYDGSTKASRMTTWLGGETESLVILNPPADCLKHGIDCVIVGADSEVVVAAHALEAHQIADEKNGVAITVFKGQRPR